jgi:hypothetical protein
MHRQFCRQALEQAQRFSIETILPEYESFYLEILEKAKRVSGSVVD